MKYSYDLIIKVSKLYYNENLNIKEISKKLKISRFIISRILQSARNLGIVKINIIIPHESHVDLENEFEQKYNLKRAVIINNEGLSENELKEKIGFYASGLLQQIISDNDVIGVSWGTTVKTILNYLPPVINQNVKIVQISSGSNLANVDIICHQLTQELAVKFNSTPYLLFAPETVKNEELKNLLIEDKIIKRVFETFSDINIVIFGIGAVTPDYLKMIIDNEQLSPEEFKFLIEKNAVADIFSHFINSDGELLSDTAKIISMPVENLKKIPYSIALAGGKDKAQAILSAIKGGFVNTLVTDNVTVNEIFRIDNK